MSITVGHCSVFVCADDAPVEARMEMSTPTFKLADANEYCIEVFNHASTKAEVRVSIDNAKIVEELVRPMSFVVVRRKREVEKALAFLNDSLVQVVYTPSASKSRLRRAVDGMFGRTARGSVESCRIEALLV